MGGPLGHCLPAGDVRGHFHRDVDHLELWLLPHRVISSPVEACGAGATGTLLNAQSIGPRA
jgi:hypothetical protein